MVGVSPSLQSHVARAGDGQHDALGLGDREVDQRGRDLGRNRVRARARIRITVGVRVRTRVRVRARARARVRVGVRVRARLRVRVTYLRWRLVLS